jgi:predicted DsbA family dithiol-disulfide isomerase
VIDLTKDRLNGFAQELGLDTSTFNTCIDSEKYMDKIIQDYNLGKEMGIKSTPIFFVNGTKVVGYKPFEYFQELIETLLGGQGN